MTKLLCGVDQLQWNWNGLQVRHIHFLVSGLTRVELLRHCRLCMCILRSVCEVIGLY